MTWPLYLGVLRLDFGWVLFLGVSCLSPALGGLFGAWGDWDWTSLSNCVDKLFEVVVISCGFELFSSLFSDITGSPLFISDGMGVRTWGVSLIANVSLVGLF